MKSIKSVRKEIICFVIIVLCITQNISATAATFDEINNPNVFLKQNTSYTCTLSAATMMVRRAALLSGNANWDSITETAMRKTAWLEGTGLYHSFNYAGISVKYSSLNGGTSNTSQLISLLKDHPEGIVIYDRDKPHAILITDYTNNTFYCADPANNIAKGRIPVSSASISIYNADNYWYVSSPKCDVDDYTPANLGTDFTAVILNKASWKPIENRYTEGNKPLVRIVDETGFANQVWYFQRQNDGSYKISSCYDGKYLDVRDASTNSGTYIQTCEDTGSDAQKWYIYEERGGYILRSKLSNYVLDLKNNDSTTGNCLHTYDYNGTDAQIWAIYRGDECTLKGPTLSISVGDSKSETKFSWNSVYAAKTYNMKIWKDQVWIGEAYENKNNASSGYSIVLPAGTYQAYVDACHFHDYKMSNIVTFTVKEHVCSYKSKMTNATCTTQGYTTYTCRSCGNNYKGNYTSALGHSFGEWILITLPTMTDYGEEMRTCVRCGDNESRYVDMLVNPFNDVFHNSYYYNSVLWAAEKNITKGTSAATFGPNEPCTRGQVVTFLWRAAGEPKPDEKRNPFIDVNPNSYCYNAVLWAVEEGITKGISVSTFEPNKTCTRGEVATFLWRAIGDNMLNDIVNPFGDVSKERFYYNAVLWAVEAGVTNGTTLTTFSPDAPCTRGQIVTFLYRAMN